MSETEHNHPRMGPCDYSCTPYREARRRERQAREALTVDAAAEARAALVAERVRYRVAGWRLALMVKAYLANLETSDPPTPDDLAAALTAYDRATVKPKE